MSDKKSEPSQSTTSFLRSFRAIVLVIALGFLANFVYQNATAADSEYPFKLGLDLAGGAHLVYEADVTDVDPLEVPDIMNVLRDVIERRVNIFGVSEPIVQVERSSFVSDNPVERLVVELPGVTDVAQAVEEIGRTPLLEFKLFDETIDTSGADIGALASLVGTSSATTTEDGELATSTPVVVPTEESEILPFRDTGLTGRYLDGAEAILPNSAHGGGFETSSYINITFDREGGNLFEQITRENVGTALGIFLDGELISAPIINEAIPGGTAVISGQFTPDEAKLLAENLKFGALPVPIELQSTQTIGATLGDQVLQKGVQAALVGFGLILAFMLLWYRLPGLVAGISLLSYVTIMLALFQFIPVTLTAAGLAGFIISLGMAVDANVLVFERMKEEYRSGVNSRTSAEVGFKRAWSAIRDGNITSLLSAIILFWFGTSLVKGFALVFGLGVIVSMMSALLVTRTLLLTLPPAKKREGTLLSFLYGNGLLK